MNPVSERPRTAQTSQHRTRSEKPPGKSIRYGYDPRERKSLQNFFFEDHIVAEYRHPGEILKLTAESLYLDSLANNNQHAWNDFSNGTKTVNLS